MENIGRGLIGYTDLLGHVNELIQPRHLLLAIALFNIIHTCSELTLGFVSGWWNELSAPQVAE